MKPSEVIEASDSDALPQRLRTAQLAELAAWSALVQRNLADHEDRAARLEQWLESIRAFREYQAQVTARSIGHSMQALREAAAVLAARSIPSAPLSLPEPAGWVGMASSGQPPRMGEVFTGRGDAQWTVRAVMHDLLEPELFLVQLECRGRDGGKVHEVYSEDWPLFCLVHNLARPARG